MPWDHLLRDYDKIEVDMNTERSVNEQLGTSHVVWNLKDLYQESDSPRIPEDKKWCLDTAIFLKEKFQSKLKSLTPADLFLCVQALENLHATLGKLSTFAFLHYTTQVDSSEAGALYQGIREHTSRCEKEIVFFKLEWNSLDETFVSTLLDDPQLAHYKHYLTSLRRYRPHQLSETVEKLLLDLQPVGRSSWNTLFEKVFGNMRFGEKQRTEEEVLTDLYDSDREIRQSAATDLTQGLKDNKHILTHIYNTQAADKMISDRLRKYDTWVNSMNLENQLSGDTVTTLIDTVVSRYDIVQRYYRIKRETLGLTELMDYDRYAPLPSLPQQKIPWQTCQKTVIDSFSQFSPQLSEIANQFFTEKWIHAPVFHGKRGGAFAHPCIPSVHPYVMVNYTGSLRDISTVAHELGHGVHQVLAAETGYYNSDTPLVVAETASVFAELLVFKAQLALLEKPEEKRAFICQKLESIFATVFRQTAMNRFENMMHEGRRQDGELSNEQLCNYWLQTQREMFGDSVTLTDDYGVWWSYIPHFLSTPGYVYSYAFGELLVLALYSLYQKEGTPFIDKYIQLLSAGGSASPYELVKPFGLDLNDKTFWLQGLNVIDSMLEEIEES